jgi:hypothetical protein
MVNYHILIWIYCYKLTTSSGSPHEALQGVGARKLIAIDQQGHLAVLGFDSQKETEARARGDEQSFSGSLFCPPPEKN